MGGAGRFDGRTFDVVVIGAGIGGVIALHYARKAGLDVVLVERQRRVGGLWAQLPAWQDIQFHRCDWTLGDLPIAGEDQASIRDNIEAWVDRFGLADAMLLGTDVKSATRDADAWRLETSAGTVRARNVIAATGGHNRPVVPAVARAGATLRELHSSALRDPRELAGRDVVVVGGGASAYDLLDLCFEHGARRVVWVYRHARWMIPTRKPKSLSGGPRHLARPQMEGVGVDAISRAMHDDLVSRYRKSGLDELLPDEPFDLRRHQIIPGRWRMLENFARIERHRGEVSRIDGSRVTLSTGTAVDADLLLWGTGYAMDLGYFTNPALSAIRHPDELASQCGCGTRALAEPGLYFLATGLEATGTAPWAYALLARTVVAHILGKADLEAVPLQGKLNHFDQLAFLAARDPLHYPAGWEAHFRRLAFDHPEGVPLPIPE